MPVSGDLRGEALSSARLLRVTYGALGFAVATSLFVLRQEGYEDDAAELWDAMAEAFDEISQGS